MYMILFIYGVIIYINSYTDGSTCEFLNIILYSNVYNLFFTLYYFFPVIYRYESTPGLNKKSIFSVISGMFMYPFIGYLYNVNSCVNLNTFVLLSMLMYTGQFIGVFLSIIYERTHDITHELNEIDNLI